MSSSDSTGKVNVKNSDDIETLQVVGTPELAELLEEVNLSDDVNPNKVRRVEPIQRAPVVVESPEVSDEDKLRFKQQEIVVNRIARLDAKYAGKCNWNKMSNDLTGEWKLFSSHNVDEFLESAGKSEDVELKKRFTTANKHIEFKGNRLIVWETIEDEEHFRDEVMIEEPRTVNRVSEVTYLMLNKMKTSYCNSVEEGVMETETMFINKKDQLHVLRARGRTMCARLYERVNDGRPRRVIEEAHISEGYEDNSDDERVSKKQNSLMEMSKQLEMAMMAVNKNKDSGETKEACEMLKRVREILFECQKMSESIQRRADQVMGLEDSEDDDEENTTVLERPGVARMEYNRKTKVFRISNL